MLLYKGPPPLQSRVPKYAALSQFFLFFLFTCPSIMMEEISRMQHKCNTRAFLYDKNV